MEYSPSDQTRHSQDLIRVEQSTDLIRKEKLSEPISVSFKSIRDKIKRRKRSTAQQIDRCYHHIDIRKLAQTFETQFSSHFAQTNQYTSNGQQQTYQADKLTLPQSRARYELFKSRALQAITQIQLCSKVWLLVSLFILIVILLDLILIQKSIPVIAILLPLKLSSHDYPTHPKHSSFLLIPTTLFLLTSFIPIVLNWNLKELCSVNSSRDTQKYLKIQSFLVVILTLASTLATMIYLIYMSLESTLIGFTINMTWFTITSIIALMTYKSSQELSLNVLEFHEFLIEFRLTPKSKLLRKHFPTMEAVVEESSNLEQSGHSETSPPPLSLTMTSSSEIFTLNSDLSQSNYTTPENEIVLESEYDQEQEPQLVLSTQANAVEYQLLL